MSGQITRRDIIEDEALRWGSEYAKVMEEAIGKNREFVDTIVALNAENVKLRRSENQTEYLKQKNEVKLLTEKTNASIKEQLTLETSLEKIKQEKIRTEKLELDAINKKSNAQKKSNALTIEERVQNEVNNRALKQSAREKLGLVGAYEKLNKSRTDAKKRLLDLLSAEERNIVAIRKAQKEYDVLDAKVRKADKAVGDFTKNVGNYPFSNAASGLRNLIGAFGLTTGIALFAGIMKGAYEVMKEFEQGVADLQAITGATGKDLDFLKSSALDLGKTVKGGAIAVVEAYKLIASAKPELLENVKALNSVTEAAIQLSQAAGMELPDAATALTDALNQFNAPAEQAGEFVDALANGAKYGAAEIPQTTEALLKFGAVARTSNISIQESVALIELLAENGIKGAEAGTKLRNVLLKISAPDALPKEARKEFERLGISLNFLKDTTIPIQEKLAALKPLLKDNSSIVKIFGDENATAAINVLSHTDRLAELIPKMGEFGTAAEQAEIRMNTLNGKTEILKSTYDSFVLSVGSSSGPISKALGTVVDSFTGVLLILERINTSWDDLFEKASNQGSKLGESTFKSLMNGKSGEEAVKQAEQNIRLARRNLQTLDAQLAETNKNIEEDSAFGAISVLDGTRKTLLGLKRDKEAIIKTQAEMAQLLKASKEFINPNKTQISAEPNDEKVITKLSDAEIKKRLDAQKKAIEEYIKLLQKRNKDEFDLNQFRIEREIYYNQLIVDDESQTNEERVNAFLQIEQLKKASLDNVLANELRVNALGSESLKAKTKAEIDAVLTRTNLEAKNIIVNGELKKNATTEEIIAYEKYILELKKIDDKSKEERQKLVDSQVSIAQKAIDEKIKIEETALNKELEAENNTYAKSLESAKDNQAEIEKATLEHEQRVFDIKKRFSLKSLDLQINDLENQISTNDSKDSSEQISTEKRNELVFRLSKYREERNRLDNENYKITKDTDVSSEEQFNQKVIELSFQLKDELVNFANAIFSAKIANIDAEIQANDDYYNRQIELAGNDSRQKELLEKERERKRLELEKKKRKSEYDAAVFNKIISLATIATQTAMASIAALAPPPVGLGPVFGASLLPFIIGTGAIQAATVIATPLPKYKDGRKGGPAELAWTGDGGRSEVISNADGSNPRLTPNVPTLTYLKEGEVVHKSEDDYQKSIRASLLNEYDKSANEVKQYQIEINNNTSNANLDKIIKKGIIDGFKKARNNVSITNKIDFGHELWKMGNTNWKLK
jgi:TP901 family phage tail tape measure protein